MEFFSHKTNIDFMRIRVFTAIFSIALIIGSIVALSINGLQLGLDFTGGTQIEIAYAQSVDLEDVREKLEVAGFGDAVVQSYGTSKDVLINVAPRESIKQAELVSQVMSALPGAEQRRVEFIGPQVGQELMTKGLLAILVSLLGTMIYIAFRFEYRLAICSALALIHDPFLILGIFSYLGIEFDLKTLAALLAVIGYSLNDTIVVFDRVRENFRKLRRGSPAEIMNISINQTLSRTIITSASTFAVVFALFLYGGETIRGFALALMLGIVIGTFSSIFVAGALAVALGLNKEDLMPAPKAEIEEGF